MSNTTKEVIAIAALVEKAGVTQESMEALRFTQAALNLAHLIHIRHETERLSEKIE